MQNKERINEEWWRMKDEGWLMKDEDFRLQGFRWRTNRWTNIHLLMNYVNTRTHKITNQAGPDRLSSGKNMNPSLFIWVYLFKSYMFECSVIELFNTRSCNSLEDLTFLRMSSSLWYVIFTPEHCGRHSSYCDWIFLLHASLSGEQSDSDI